ncbi:MAG: choice-of-anchor Q domain-containing protein [Kofleriaceae bacterium]
MGNGSDTGTCTKDAPCRTIGYAVSKVGLSSRNVIRVTGGATAADAATVAVNVALTIDGTSTKITKPAGTIPWLRVDSPGNVTLEGVTVIGPAEDDTNPTINVGTNATLVIGPGTDMIGTIRVEDGTVRVERGQVSSGISCSTGTVDIVDALFTSVNEGLPQVGAQSCGVTVRRSRFSHVGPMIRASGGKVVVENNVFASKLEYADAVAISNVQSGSVFTFNTVVNTVQSDTGDGVALNCDATLDVSNNIFAYRSQHPFMYAAGCLAKYSVFDDVALPLPTTPIESSFHPFVSLFENPVFGDFHLSSGSPARQAADPASDVTEDLEGNVRPRPTGTRADVGAFEAD